MQLMFILSIAFAILAVFFAFQNDTPVTLTLGTLSVDSSLALVLLVAMGAGAFIASLISTPGMIRNQSSASRLKRKTSSLEERNIALERRVRELENLPPLAQPAEPPEPVRRSPNLGLRSALFQRKSIE